MAVSTWIHRVSRSRAGCFGSPWERAEQPALGSGWASSVAGPPSGCLGSDAGRASQEAARHRQRSLGSDVLQFSLVLDVTQLCATGRSPRSEEHTSELQSLMRISYAVFCLKKKNKKDRTIIN